MGSLKKCLKKIGIPEHEAAILRGEVKDYLDDGYAPHEAAVRAVKGYIESLVEERADVVKQLTEKGISIADVPSVPKPEVPPSTKELNKEPDKALFSRSPQTETESFRKQFGKYIIADVNGNPLVLYHGTIGDITEFDPSRMGENTGAKSAKKGFFFTDRPEVAESYANYAATDAKISALLREAEKAEKAGDWNAYDKKVVEYEALDASFRDSENRLSGQNILPVYLSMKNPLSVDAKGENAVGFDISSAIRDAVRGKHDGLIIRNLDDAVGLTNKIATHYVVFKREQIKSAIGNRGTFDPNDPNILFRRQDNKKSWWSWNKKSNLSIHGIDANVKNNVAALEKAGQSSGDFKITSGKLLDSVLERNPKDQDLKVLKVLQDLFGAPVVMVSSTGKLKFNGAHYQGYVYLNVDSNKSLPLVFGHELSHAMERDNPKAYAALLGAVEPILRNRGEYENRNFLKGFSDKDISKEMLGDLMGGRFGEQEFWKQVSDNLSKTEFQKIINAIRLWLDRAIAKLRRIESHEFVSDLEAARKMLAKAVADYAIEKNGGKSETVSFQRSNNDTAPIWYSALERGIESAKQNSMPAKQWALWLEANRSKLGIKTDEIDAVGLKEYLDLQTGSITNEQVIDFVRQNGVQVIDGFFDDYIDPKKKKEYDRREREILDLRDRGGRIGHDDAAQRLDSLRKEMELNKHGENIDGTKYRYSQLPGGNNYKEIFLALPDLKGYSWKDGHSEYNDIINPIVRIRANERLDSSGEKVFFLEEVQGPDKSQEPNMPPWSNVSNRSLQAIKWAIRYAVENGFKKIAWTTGTQQVQRSQSKGMIAYYDQMLPQWVNKYVKKFDSKVSDVEIDTRRPEDSSYYNALTDADILKQPGFEITPAMRDSVMQGQPLFSRDTKGRPGLFGMEYTGPIDMALKAIVKVTKFDRATTYAHDVLLKEKLGSLVPERIKAGIVNRYGVPADVRDMHDQVNINKFKAIRKTGTLVERISSISREESQVLHTIMSSDDQIMTDYLSDRLSNEGKEFITDTKSMISSMTREAISVGLISEDAALRNKNAYVHRSYKKYTNFDSDKAEVATRTRAMRIMGDTYKGRGMRQDVSMEKLALETKAWWKRKIKDTGEVDTSLKGEMFIRLERRGPLDTRTETLSGIPASNKKGRLIEVRYWPVNETIPESMKNWEKDIVPWEARFFDKPKNIGMWRDLVPAERSMMGEIDEVRYITAKTIILMAHDIEVARYFNWVGDKYGKSVLPSGTKVVEGSEQLRHAYTPDDWVHVPETKISGTSLFIYGKLADKYLPGPIWNDIRQITRMHSQNVLPDALAKVIRLWKINKTALTPGVHTNNIMGNVMMADWHDVLARHTAKATLVMWKKSSNPEYASLYKDFEESGATLGMFAHQELRDEIMQPLEEALREELRGAENELGESLAISGILSLIKQGHIAAATGESIDALMGTKSYEKAAKVVGKAIDDYQIEDEVFRLAAFIKAKEDGKTNIEAGKFAKNSFLDYDITAPWISALRQTILPFIAFLYRAIPMMVETAAHRPWKVLKILLIAGSLNSLFYAMLGSDGDEDKERAVLPPEKRGKIWGIIPKLIRLPGNYHGSPVFLDIRRFVVVGDVLDIEQSNSAIPLPPPIQPSGPINTIAEIVFNRSGFTGKDITKETDTVKEKTLAVIDHLWKSFMPNFPGLPGSYATKGILNAGTGKTDDFGREQSLWMALLSSVGIKISAYPRDVAVRSLEMEHNRDKQEIEGKIFGIRRELSNKGITKEQYEIKLQYQLNKLRKIDEEFSKHVSQ